MRIILFGFLFLSIKAISQNFDTTYANEIDTSNSNFNIIFFKNNGILKINSNKTSIDNRSKTFSEFYAGFIYEITKNLNAGFNFSTINFQKTDTISLKKLYNFGIEINYSVKSTEKTNISIFFIPSISSIQLSIPSKNKIISNTTQLKGGSNFTYKITKRIALSIGINYFIQNFHKFVYSLNKPYKIDDNKNLSIKLSGISIGGGIIIKVS